MPGIFISYRREDSAGHAGRLFDRLTQHFGKERVFMDVSDIAPGTDFVEAIDKAVGSCEILIVVIGRQWLSCAEPDGRRRLDNPHDFIRLEAATALSRDVRVVPVLVQGARMPKTEELPADLQKLSRRQAIEISDTRWDSDVGRLINALEGTLSGETDSAPAAPSGKSVTVKQPKRKQTGLIIGIIFALALAIVGWFLWPQNVEVPRITGNALEAAKIQLAERGFALGKVSAEPSEGAAVGTIVKQEPEAGTRAAKGARIDVAVAVAPQIAVPDVMRQSFADAEILLRKAGLVVGRKTLQVTDDVAPGIVTRQTPAGGDKLEKGGAVDLVLAVRAKVSVPDLVRQTRAQAEDTLQKAGLIIGSVSESAAPGIRPGTVLSQSPPSGRALDKGAKVDLVIAAAVASEAGVIVPTVVRLDLARAKTIVEDSGLLVGAVRERESVSARPGTVLSQSLRPGQQVAKNAKIDLTVALAPAKPIVSQADYDAVQALYIALRPMTDCREIRPRIGRLKEYYSNRNLAPENVAYTVINPERKTVATIADVARDRVIRIQGAKKECF